MLDLSRIFLLCKIIDMYLEYSKTILMTEKQIDEKQPAENTEIVKDEHDPKENFIFKNSRITITGFIIITVILIILIAGIIYSGVFFQDPDVSLPHK